MILLAVFIGLILYSPITFSICTITYWTSTSTATLVWDDSARNSFSYKTITLSDGTNSYVIMDRNLWARTGWDGTNFSTPLTDGQYDSEEDYYWYYYQWWNKYGFSLKTTSSSSNIIDEEISDVTEDSTYYNTNWNKRQPWNTNNNIRWNTTNTDSARQWPCPDWWHVYK